MAREFRDAYQRRTAIPCLLTQFAECVCVVCVLDSFAEAFDVRRGFQPGQHDQLYCLLRRYHQRLDRCALPVRRRWRYWIFVGGLKLERKSRQKRQRNKNQQHFSPDENTWRKVWHVTPYWGRTSTATNPPHVAAASEWDRQTDGQAERRTDGRTPYRFIDSAAHTMRPMSVITAETIAYSVKIT